MVTVVSPELLTVGAAWDAGPEAGSWIAKRLGPFGDSVGHAVPLGYSAYGVVPIPFGDESETGSAPLIVIDALLDDLAPFTDDQPVHCGMWEGWPWWRPTRAAPRTPSALAWPEPARKAQAETERVEAREDVVAKRVECPDAEPLDLPARRYYLWTGPLRSVTAFRHRWEDPPSLVWPEDRSWFVGAPIWTNEIAVAGTQMLIDAVVGDPRLNAHHATPDDILNIDD